jgi:HSP20 family protein
MTAEQSKEIQVKPKQEVTGPSEQTRPGVVYTPDVDIFETDKEIVLLADMPGVAADNLTIDLRDDTLTLSGDAEAPDTEGHKPLLAEYGTGRYFRKFSLSDVIDQANIDAQLKDGVLRLTLPKVAKATPRTIAVQAV